jgi:predicted amidophosphoribosyltransferase
MKKRLYSLKDLKAALNESALRDGLVLSDAGEHAKAVASFDMLKDFSTIDTESRSRLKISYCTHGKHLQHEGKLEEALRCFSRAREAYPDDILLLERTKLLVSRQEYRTLENIGKFRRYFSFGLTSGEFEKYEYPFVEIAKQKGILQEPQIPAQSSLMDDAIKSVGVYRIQAQGRHILSYKIREYKGGNPSLALPFSWLIADFVRSLTEFVKFVDVIVPSPSNPNKYLARGFIPSLLIGKGLSKCLAIPYRELFSITPMECRFRDLPYAQAKELIKYREKRIDKIVFGHQVLLLDDVITTGRTLTLLADLLKSAGATAVYGLALAKTGAAKEGLD